MNFDFNFWSILFLILGYALGSFTKRVGTSNEIDQIIRDAAQIQATNRELEVANDKLNDTLFESTKENQRLLNDLEDLRWAVGSTISDDKFTESEKDIFRSVGI